MTSYIKATDFAVKDSLISGNPSKLVKGTEINTEFAAIQAADATNVKSSGSSTDNAIMRFDGIGGYSAQNSPVIIDDSGVVSGATNLTYTTGPTGSAVIPSGTTGQRDGTPVFGYTRANSTTGQMEWWDGAAWSSIGGGATGSGGDQVFYENDTSVTTSHTINRNSHAVGPISIASGVTLTVATGKRLVVL